MAQTLTRNRLLILLFTLAYTLGFGAYFISHGNFEFAWYVFVLLGFIAFISYMMQKVPLPDSVLVLLSAWGLLHMMGGGIPVGESVLYSYRIFPFYDGGGEFFILKFDQLVHMYGFGVGAVAIHWLIRTRAPSVKPLWRSLLAALASMGLGTVNEVAEFAAVIAVEETGVGGYHNIALDLVFNLIGALLAVGVLELYLHLKKKA